MRNLNVEGSENQHFWACLTCKAYFQEVLKHIQNNESFEL